jgi:hypothetical protein
MSEADAGKPFDLAVDYFVSMPVWTDLGDPGFQIWMSHTPAGNMIDNPLGVSPEQNELVSYSGECISLYTHCGTHVDTFAHFGLHGQIFNRFNTKEHLGSRHWNRGGADKQPPVLARGVMIDAAASRCCPTATPSARRNCSTRSSARRPSCGQATWSSSAPGG